MSDNQYEDLFEDDSTETQNQDQENGPKALREAYKKAQARAKELEAELNEIRGKQRESEIAQKLSAAGLPSAAAKFAKDADDIDAWIQENGGLFGGAREPEQSDDGATSGGAPSLSPEQIQQMQSTQVQTASQFNPGSQDQRLATLDTAGSKEEFYRLLNENGMRKQAGSF